MAEVNVFVDDAVLGRLPAVCARDGVFTTSKFRIVSEIGRSNRLGILWLLFFAGPFGWIALVFLSTRSSGEHLAVELPYSEAAYGRFVTARRLRNNAAIIGASVGVGLLFLTAQARLGEAGAMLILATLVVTVTLVARASWEMGRESIGVDLDASRRWVTLHGVHPAFAAACQEQRGRQYQL